MEPNRGKTSSRISIIINLHKHLDDMDTCGGQEFVIDLHLFSFAFFSPFDKKFEKTKAERIFQVLTQIKGNNIIKKIIQTPRGPSLFQDFRIYLSSSYVIF